MSSLQPYLEGYKHLPPPAPWLRRIQESALERASLHGFPAPRDEAWKYSSTATLEKRAFTPARDKTALSAAALAAFAIPGLDASRLAFIDGRYEPTHSNPPAGLRVTVIDSAAAELEESLAAPPSWEDDTFLNLNTALFRDGLSLELAPGTVLEMPLELLYVSTSREQGTSHHPRCYISPKVPVPRSSSVTWGSKAQRTSRIQCCSWHSMGPRAWSTSASRPRALRASTWAGCW
jgi:Fe-S cluster assembly protein SufD